MEILKMNLWKTIKKENSVKHNNVKITNSKKGKKQTWYNDIKEEINYNNSNIEDLKHIYFK